MKNLPFNRNKRLLEIRKLIKRNKISNQEELLKLLYRNGFVFTQATLSRDLKLLKVGKKADDEKGHIYFLPDETENTSDAERDLRDAAGRGFISVDYSGNMAVIKTLPGFASGIAYSIDGLKAFEIIGTIAGDDTILVIARDGISRRDIHNVISGVVPVDGRR